MVQTWHPAPPPSLLTNDPPQRRLADGEDLFHHPVHFLRWANDDNGLLAIFFSNAACPSVLEVSLCK